MMQTLKRIVVLGPESTGKSTLCEQLAKHYSTIWVPEYAREYLEGQNGDYNYDDLLAIAKGQLTLEDRMCKDAKNGLLFIDTNMHVMKVWAEFVFSKCHNWILEQIVYRQYDHYLLCNIDLPWVADRLREYPDLARRQELFAIYKDIMVNQHVPWTLISGDHEQRLKTAIDAVNSIQKK